MTHTRPLLAAAFLLCTGLPTMAEDTRTLAEEYAALPGVQQMMNDMFSADAMAAQFAASLPPEVQLSDAQRAKIGALLSDAMIGMKPEVERLMIEGSAKVFSADELQALIDFYSSEHGGAVMTKLQPFMQEVMGDMAPAIHETMQGVTPQIVEIIQEE